MGLHKSVDTFKPSDPSQTTQAFRRKEPETRIPAVGAHAGAWVEARPGCKVSALVQMERDVAEALRLQAKAKSVVRKSLSKNGVLRTRRSTV